MTQDHYFEQCLKFCAIKQDITQEPLQGTENFPHSL